MACTTLEEIWPVFLEVTDSETSKTPSLLNVCDGLGSLLKNPSPKFQRYFASAPYFSDAVKLITIPVQPVLTLAAFSEPAFPLIVLTGTGGVTAFLWSAFDDCVDFLAAKFLFVFLLRSNSELLEILFSIVSS